MKAPSTKYPSPAEVKVFINNNWIDDAYRVDYTVSNPRTPLYDYTSTFYKDVAEGHTIVHGQIVINFRFVGYLTKAIEDPKAFRPESFQSRSLNKQSYPDPARNVDQSSELMRDLLEGSDNEKISKLLGYKRLGALDQVKQVSDFLFSDNPKGDLTKQAGTDSTTHRKRTPFNLEIRYGGQESLYNKVIQDCYIVGESQVISAAAVAGGDMSASGMPIFEVYSFFGRRIKDEVTEKAVNLNLKYAKSAIGDNR